MCRVWLTFHFISVICKEIVQFHFAISFGQDVAQAIVTVSFQCDALKWRGYTVVSVLVGRIARTPMPLEVGSIVIISARDPIVNGEKAQVLQHLGIKTPKAM